MIPLISPFGLRDGSNLINSAPQSVTLQLYIATLLRRLPPRGVSRAAAGVEIWLRSFIGGRTMTDCAATKIAMLSGVPPLTAVAGPHNPSTADGNSLWMLAGPRGVNTVHGNNSLGETPVGPTSVSNPNPCSGLLTQPLVQASLTLHTQPPLPKPLGISSLFALPLWFEIHLKFAT